MTIEERLKEKSFTRSAFWGRQVFHKQDEVELILLSDALKICEEKNICNNCRYWDNGLKACMEDNLIGCISLMDSPFQDGAFGCNQFQREG